jgi:orotidine-5'-phosphate decarboxylase
MTVHASGGEAMMKAAVQGLADVGTQVLAVTVLTSFDPATCEEIYTRQPLDQVMKLAAIADRAGVHGFVCSPEEVQTLSQSYPGKTFVIPGVRSEGKDVGEQKRVGTPKGAMNAGATNIVMGRQLFEAPDPVAEFNRVMKEELDLSP